MKSICTVTFRYGYHTTATGKKKNVTAPVSYPDTQTHTHIYERNPSLHFFTLLPAIGVAKKSHLAQHTKHKRTASSWLKVSMHFLECILYIYCFRLLKLFWVFTVIGEVLHKFTYFLSLSHTFCHGKDPYIWFLHKPV